MIIENLFDIGKKMKLRLRFTILVVTNMWLVTTFLF